MSMPKRTLYRYDTKEHAPDQIITACGDHISRLTPGQREVESALRGARPDGGEVRGKSIYGYIDAEFAEFAWRRKKGMHLYEIEVDEQDVLHVANLDAFTAVETAMSKGESPDEPIQEYWSGADSGRRGEVLAKKARVVRKIKDASEH
jgi:hypothetical protein